MGGGGGGDGLGGGVSRVSAFRGNVILRSGVGDEDRDDAEST
jgi:hypothetical protein